MVADSDCLQGNDNAQNLRAQLAGKHGEALALQAQIQESKLKIQHLRLRLQNLGLTETNLIPSRIQTGNSVSKPQHVELQSILQWIVENVDLRHQVVFECGDNESEIIVNGRHVLLQRMVTWPLSMASEAGLKLSVPLDFHDMVVNMLSAARSRGCINEADVCQFADSWEMVSAEIVSATMGSPEPSIFLVHRVKSQAIIVAPWPSVLYAQANSSAYFNPAQHFSQLKDMEVAKAVRPSVCTGDRVEVEYKGHWFTGVLHNVDGNTANIKCDVDSPGVITVAPLTNVRPARAVPEDTPKKMPHRMRARSVG